MSTFTRLARRIRPRAVVLGLLCVATVGVLIAAYQPPHRADLENGAKPDVTAATDTEAMPVRPATPKAVVSTTPATPAALEAHAARSRENPAAGNSPKTTAVRSDPKAPPVKATPKASAVGSTSTATATKSDALSDARNSPPITITGCLERDADTFWLKDTSGTDAPTSRSWRSGFLKKRSVSIELVDVTHTLRLLGYIGQRVAATGNVMNREMHARSLRRVAASCT